MAEKVNTVEEPTPAPALEDDALAASLVEEDTPEPVAETPVTEETPAEPVEEAPEETPAEPEPAAETTEESPAPDPEPEPEPTPQPGTPNKAIQKLQMEQSAVSRQLAAIHELIQQQGTATPRQIEKVADLTEKANELETLLAKPEFDPFVDAPEGFKIVSKKAAGQDSRIAALEKRVQQAEAIAAQAQEQAQWTAVEQNYPGVDVRSKYAEAQTKAQSLGYAGESLYLRSNEIFHELAKAATAKPVAKPVAMKPATTIPKAPVKPVTARKVPPTTPGGTSVTANGGIKRPAPVSDESFMDNLADRLVE